MLIHSVAGLLGVRFSFSPLSYSVFGTIAFGLESAAFVPLEIVSSVGQSFVQRPADFNVAELGLAGRRNRE